MSSFRDAAMLFLCSAASCLFVGHHAVRALARAQCLAPVRYEDCPPLQTYQASKPRVPTMGGVFVLAVGMLAAILAGGLSHRDGWLVLMSIAAMGAVGCYDDWLKFRRRNAGGLRSLPKLLVALGVGAVVGFAGQTKPGRDAGGLEGWLWVPFAMLVVAGSSHAVNLTDGMDGLAAGCLAIAFSLLGVWAMTDGPARQVLVPWCAGLAGACVGFLWFNSFPASVVLGDVGALGLGAGLGAVSLLGHTAWWLLVVGGVFVAEALSVMLQVASYKWRGGRRIFRVAPLHHHVHLGGMSEPKLVVRFWIAGLVLAMIGLALR